LAVGAVLVLGLGVLAVLAGRGGGEEPAATVLPERSEPGVCVGEFLRWKSGRGTTGLETARGERFEHPTAGGHREWHSPPADS